MDWTMFSINVKVMSSPSSTTRRRICRLSTFICRSRSDESPLETRNGIFDGHGKDNVFDSWKLH
jgi:hypothetical protein